jgi:hypothetical protein
MTTDVPPYPPGLPAFVITKLRIPPGMTPAEVDARCAAYLADRESVTIVTLLRCACGIDKEITESWVPADMCGRCGMPLRRVEVERRRR